MTAYLPTVRYRHLSSTDVNGAASSAIQVGMSNGSLAKSNNAIVKLTYLNDGSSSGTVPSNSTNATTLPPLEGSNNNSTITLNSTGSQHISSSNPMAWALVGVFGGILVIAIVALTYFKRRQKKRREEPKNPVVHDIVDDTTIVSSSTTHVVSLLQPKKGRSGVVLSDAVSVNEETRRKTRSWG